MRDWGLATDIRNLAGSLVQNVFKAEGGHETYSVIRTPTQQHSKHGGPNTRAAVLQTIGLALLTPVGLKTCPLPGSDSTEPKRIQSPPRSSEGCPNPSYVGFGPTPDADAKTHRRDLDRRSIG